MKNWGKALVSLALLFHLFAVFVLPNPESLLNRQTSWLLFPYGNFLGINTTWRFFSPNPSIKSLAFEAYAYDEYGDVTFEKTGLFPESVETVGSRESFNRMMNYAMLVSSTSQVIESVLKPHLCQKYSQADEISFFHVDYVLPSIERAQLDAGDFQSMATERRMPLPSVNCKEESSL